MLIEFARHPISLSARDRSVENFISREKTGTSDRKPFKKKPS
jgi:hypothetical protein